VLGEDGAPVKYKTGPKKGEIKLKNYDRKVEIVGKLDGSRFSTKNARGWATGEAVLKKITHAISGTATSICVKNMLKARALNKDLSAYYEGYSKLLWHDDLLHPSYHHCATDTGRLSCSKPNLMQVTST